MKTFIHQAAQGDVLLTRISSVPKDAKEMKAENGHYVVAHSETGHHHVVPQSHATAYEAANDPFVMFLVVEEETALRHNRSFDTHEPIQLPPGAYQINRQREHTPDGFRRAAD